MNLASWVYSGVACVLEIIWVQGRNNIQEWKGIEQDGVLMIGDTRVTVSHNRGKV